jgi:hypothetical protein
VVLMDLDQLVDHWTLLTDERELVAGKRGPTRLGFALLLKLACDEGWCRILSQSARRGRSPVVGGRLVVRYRPSRLIVGCPSGESLAVSAGSSG